MTGLQRWHGYLGNHLKAFHSDLVLPGWAAKVIALGKVEPCKPGMSKAVDLSRWEKGKFSRKESSLGPDIQRVVLDHQCQPLLGVVRNAGPQVPSRPS